MTKAELTEIYREWNVSISKKDARKREIFEELKQMCPENGGCGRWCSIGKLVEALSKTGNLCKAMPLVSEYYKIIGQQEASRNLAISINNKQFGNNNRQSKGR